ncbi:hypothetical protein [Pseudomonas sp. Pseu.R1]|uniref:hypothetical protein n=1 Tax=Pseudomonas sp. Pseu.R1 TaxID=3379818 RepID=UPI003B937E8E
MTDDLIDCTGFEDLGVPTPLECWKQQAHLLACEVGDLQKDLSSARRNIHKLVGMHTAVAKERDALALEVIELKWRVSDMLREQDMAAAAKNNPFENCHHHGPDVRGLMG